MYNNELYHHGILGMKWGVRRYQNSDGSLTSAGRKRQAKKENKAVRKERATAKKNRRILSDADIQKRINRLKSEQELSKLTEQDLHPGRSAVGRVIGSAGNKVVTAAVAGATAYAVKAILTKKFNIETLADYAFPNPNKKK